MMKKRGATTGPSGVGRLLLTVASFAAALVAPVAAGAATGYTVKDLGTLGGSYSLGLAINNGTAVGESASATGTPRGFVFSHDVLSDIGTLPGGRFASATAINERGQITGTSETSIPVGSGFEEHAFLYDHGQMTDLGTSAESPASAPASTTRATS